MGMSKDKRRSRASSGGKKYAASRKRFAPLRKIVSEDEAFEYLECGHSLSHAKDMMGRTYPARRRCIFCLDEKEADS